MLAGFGRASASSSLDQAQRQQLAALVADAVHSGVQVVAGTAQGMPGFSLQRELELYVQGGMTPAEALRSATVVPAQMLKMGDSGTLLSGKRADIVVLAKNPLDDIANVGTAKWVVANGKLYDCQKLWQVAGFKGS